MTYYLDTSTILSCHKKLALLPSDVSVQTSYLAVMEIITGIPADCNDMDISGYEKEFKSRRSSLENLLDSNILINEIWVDEVIDRAFNYSSNSQDNLYFSNAVKKLSTLIIQSHNYKTFISSLDSLGFRKQLNDLQAFDEHTSKCFTTTSYQQIKNSLTHPDANNFPSEQPPESLSDIRNYLNSNEGFEWNYSMCLYALQCF